jgi:hypothetical protein
MIDNKYHEKTTVKATSINNNNHRLLVDARAPAPPSQEHPTPATTIATTLATQVLPILQHLPLQCPNLFVNNGCPTTDEVTPINNNISTIIKQEQEVTTLSQL